MIYMFCGSATVTIAIGPQLPLSLIRPQSQVSGIDSNGDRYVYGRSIAVRQYRSVFPAVTESELSALDTLINTAARGARNPIYYQINNAELTQSARYRSHTVKRTSPGIYRVELTMEETL